MDLLPVWPLLVGIVVLAFGVAWLFLAGASSHRGDWCRTCREPCRDGRLCHCCWEGL